PVIETEEELLIRGRDPALQAGHECTEWHGPPARSCQRVHLAREHRAGHAGHTQLGRAADAVVAENGWNDKRGAHRRREWAGGVATVQHAAAPTPCSLPEFGAGVVRPR